MLAMPEGHALRVEEAGAQVEDRLVATVAGVVWRAVAVCLRRLLSPAQSATNR